ncbi:type II secretory pathway ATPase PulE/Tfp pilus assembly pathway ATPase PilB [Burkholderiales bacterium GJ-E10]|nr:type II secretory pathway ATPase PulE/Tfp pilus assembly pathway ATPase PilB [Burkholderiales bacterium GJ-E10]
MDRSSPHATALRDDTPSEKPIGQILVEHRAATTEQVERAIALQETLREQKLGEILVHRQIVAPEELSDALAAQSRMPMARLGEVLVSLNLIDQAKLDAALAIQQANRNIPLGELLVREGMISRDDLRSALARKMGYPVVDAHRFPVEVEALKHVPYAIARRLHALPLAMLDGRLVIGIEDVTQRAALDEIEFVSGCKVVAALASRQDIDDALPTVYARIGANLEPAAGALDFCEIPLAPLKPEPVGSSGGLRHKARANGRGLEPPPPPVDIGKLAEELEQVETEAPVNAPAIEQSDNSLVRLINQMIIEAHTESASDIHIECWGDREKVRIRFRKDGRLRPYLELPNSYANALVSRIKIMCDLDISERRKPQDGKINFARFSPQHKLELRVATIPTNNGQEDVVMRLLAAAKAIPLDRMDLSPDNLLRLRSMVERPYGLVLCVGPTGSGKTTTLHSALGHINTSDRKIWTAEDPVEITQAGLRQVQVNPKIDWTFAKALRAFLRADPDVIMVGEARDAETAHMVVEASLTGHLVFSTLHTNTAPETVTRLIDLGVDPFNFADALLGVLAQRLVRRICPHCRTERPATAEEIEELLSDYLGSIHNAGTAKVLRKTTQAEWQHRYGREGVLMRHGGAGCSRCGGTGLLGRVAIHELMVSNPEVRHLIQARATPAEVQQCAMRNGMQTLRQDGIEKVLQGLTTIEEVRATSNQS